MATSNSLFIRGLLAVVLLVGFYILAIGLALTLLLLPVAEVLFAERIHLKLALLCVVGALMILWSIVPRIDRFQAPGPRLSKEDNPKLFEQLEDVAQQTSQQMPAEVYLVRDINAWVTERGGIMGFGSRRVMGLGLPLMQVLTVSELRAVLAHEFGHFHGGDTKLGPWIYKTRAAMARTIENLAGTELGFMSLVTLPFIAYNKLFLRITLAISRAQEYAADALAARTQGSRPLSEGLKKIRGAAMAFDPYFGNEVLPALESGFHPPIAQGFARFVAEPHITEAIDKAVAHAMETDQTDPYDTHPALKDRLAAVAEIDPGTLTDNTDAVSLLGDVAASERALLNEILVDSSLAARLQPIDWGDVGRQIYAPRWKEQTAGNAEHLAGVTPTTLPDDDALLALVRDAVPGAAGAPDDAVLSAGRGMIGAALATALTERGWTLSAQPGAAVIMSSGDLVIEPFNFMAQLSSGELAASDWAATVEAAGIAALDLGPTR